MTTRLFTPDFPPGLPPLAVFALVICLCCSMAPVSAQDNSPNSLAGAVRQPIASSNAFPSRFGRSMGQYPDPRYRPPANFSELQAVAGDVAKAAGRQINWHLELGPNPGPLAVLRKGTDDCTISIHPIAARKVPPNTWAFIFGHEYAHWVERQGKHSQSNPADELKADIAGARYAMAAGYRIEAFLGWVLTEPNQSSMSHGSLHERVRSIAAHFGIPQTVIQAEAKRYSTYRATH